MLRGCLEIPARGVPLSEDLERLFSPLGRKQGPRGFDDVSRVNQVLELQERFVPYDFLL